MRAFHPSGATRGRLPRPQPPVPPSPSPTPGAEEPATPEAPSGEQPAAPGSRPEVAFALPARRLCSPFRAFVTVTRAADPFRVVVRVDGRRVRTTRRRVARVRIDPVALGAGRHRLAARIEAGGLSTTATRAFRVCRRVDARPRFTG